MDNYELGNLIAAAAKTGSKVTTEKGAIRALRQHKLTMRALDARPKHMGYLPKHARKLIEKSCLRMPRPSHVRNWYPNYPTIKCKQPYGYIGGHANTGARKRKGNSAFWYPIGYYYYNGDKLHLATHDKQVIIPAPQVPHQPKEGKGSKAILRAMRILGAKWGWTAERVEGEVAYIHPVWGHYHPEEGNYQNISSAGAAFLAREALAKRRQEELRGLTHIWVTEEDSLKAGNCEPVTRQVRVLVQRKIGRVHAVRADVLLEIRDDAYARRAIRVAAERLGRIV